MAELTLSVFRINFGLKTLYIPRGFRYYFIPWQRQKYI
jgi:hypothetical protein